MFSGNFQHVLVLLFCQSGAGITQVGVLVIRMPFLSVSQVHVSDTSQNHIAAVSKIAGSTDSVASNNFDIGFFMLCVQTVPE